MDWSKNHVKVRLIFTNIIFIRKITLSLERLILYSNARVLGYHQNMHKKNILVNRWSDLHNRLKFSPFTFIHLLLVTTNESYSVAQVIQEKTHNNGTAENHEKNEGDAERNWQQRIHSVFSQVLCFTSVIYMKLGKSYVSLRSYTWVCI
jgi:hypothetical protein